MLSREVFPRPLREQEYLKKEKINYSQRESDDGSQARWRWYVLSKVMGNFLNDLEGRTQARIYVLS